MAPQNSNHPKMKKSGELLVYRVFGLTTLYTTLCIYTNIFNIIYDYYIYMIIIYIIIIWLYIIYIYILFDYIYYMIIYIYDYKIIYNYL
jgi:hypothetical protein